MPCILPSAWSGLWGACLCMVCCRWAGGQLLFLLLAKPRVGKCQHQPVLSVCCVSWPTQERIMTIPYGVGTDAEVFKFSLFLVFCNRVVAATVAAITLVVSAPKGSSTPVGSVSSCVPASDAHTCAAWCSNSMCWQVHSFEEQRYADTSVNSSCSHQVGSVQSCACQHTLCPWIKSCPAVVPHAMLCPVLCFVVLMCCAILCSALM